MSQGLRRIVRSLASLAMLGALLVGVPLALAGAATARFGSAFPLAGVRPPWHWDVGAVADALARPLGDDAVIDVIVRVGLVTVWIALAIVLLTTLAETVHVVRHRGFTLPDVRGLGWAQRIGRFIAAGLIVIGPLTSVRTSAAPPALAVVVPAVTARVDGPIAMTTADMDEAPRPVGWPLVDRRRRSTGRAEGGPTPGDSTVQLDPAVGPPTTHVVERGESVYSIAEGLAGGDPARTVEIADAILDANLGGVMSTGQRFTNPAYIEPGWVLVLPDAAPSGAEAALEPDPQAGPQPTGSTQHVVVEGDTLSAIAAEHLGDAHAWPVLWAENGGRVMNDGRTFDDPNLILPGWRLDLPRSPTPADDGPTAPMSTTPTPVVTTDDPAMTSSVPADDAADAGGDAATPTPASTRSEHSTTTVVTTSTPAPTTTTATTTTTNATTTTTTTGAIAAGEGGERGAAEDVGHGAPSPLRIEHAAMLAAGVLALVAVRRRRRLRASRPRTRVPEPRADVSATERRLRTIDAGERATRVDVAVRAAAAELVGGEARIGLVAVGLDGDVELRLTADGALSEPWHGSGASWNLPASVPVEMLAERARTVGAPCVALAQVGVSADGADVLVDLEAAGLLTVEAAPEVADQVVTALAAGLGGSLYAEVAHLVTVSLPADATLGHRNAHVADSLDAALELAAALAGSTLSHSETTFALRCHQTGGEVWEPVALLLASADTGSGDGVSAPRPGHGLAIVAATAPGAVGAAHRLIAGAAGWSLEAFGCATELTPVGLSPDDLADVTRLLDDAALPLVETGDETGDETGLGPADGPATDPRDEVSPPAVTFVQPDHEIVVSLMGPVEVTDRAGERGVFERSKTVELIAWLATHREHSTRQAARTALWELDVRDATFANVVSEARRGLARLVAPPEGVEWLERTLSEELPLHPAVVTDAQLVEERLRVATMQPPAQAIDTLRPAVELIRDVPFAGTSYLWPDAEGLTSNLVLLTTTVTAELAGHGLSTGDIDLVFWATARGLKVLPGHEELIGLRMRAHAKAGDLAAVRQEWEAYERVIVADAWSDGEPAPKLLQLRRELLSTQP